MKKKLIMLITAGICILSLVAFTACGEEETPAEEPTQATEATEPEEIINEGGKVVTDAAYDPVINKYKEVEQNGFKASEEDIYTIDYEGSGDADGTDGYVNGMLLEDLKDTEGGHVYYALYDINSDTCDELIIGAGDSVESARIYDIFTYDEGAALRILPGDVCLGYRVGCNIFKDGIVEVIGSGGAAAAAFTFYEIPSDSLRLKEISALAYEGDPADPDGPAEYRDGPELENEITEEDFNNIKEDFEKAGEVSLDWQPVL